MTRLGGPNAINGFLYQLLHHIDLITNVELSKRRFRAERVILEPSDGGGACAEESSYVWVEQY